MITVIAVICLAALAWPIATASSAPASTRTRERDAERRARFVAAHPQQANSLDIERLLLAGGIEPGEARLVVERAADAGIKPFTMWMWAQQYDARTLAVVVAADLSHQELLTHLGNNTVPDLASLALFASLNGLAVTERGLKTPVTARVVLSGGRDLGRTTPSVPPIFEPGSWPYTEWDSHELPSAPVQGDDGIAA